MTIVASAWQTDFPHCLGVTFSTFQSLVLSGQRKVGLTIVIEAPIFPRSGAVTGFTLYTETTTMLVILSMTGNARDRCILEGFGFVTFFALHSRVLAQQGECRQAMIKPGALPGRFVVTAIALLAFLSLVDIILLVAGITGFTQVFPAQNTLVAGGTLDPVMFASQREATLLEMVETGPGPAGCGVTFFTAGTEFSAMPLFVVVLAMAGITLARCFLVVLVGMAGFALGLPVAPV